MNSSLHSIEQEELMAYLDCELSADRAAVVAAHLEECAECQAWAVESRGLSGQLLAWQVEPSPQSLTDRMTAAIAASKLKPYAPDLPAPSRLITLPRWAWVTAGAVGLFLLIAAVAIPTLLHVQQKVVPASSATTRMGEVPLPTTLPPGAYPGAPSMTVHSGSDDALRYQEWAARSANAGPSARGGGGAETGPPISGPMIVRNASLKLLAKDFDKTRAAVEEVVRRHGGYSAQLVAGSNPNGARTFSARFRLPADQLDAAIAEIKPLARVEQESQDAEEVTEQYGDLAARLSNARRTEQTLLDVLDKRTGKLSDVLAVEQELARVREEIESIEMQSKTLQNRVSYANLRVELREEYKAELEMTPPSVGGRLRNAMVEGYRTAVDSVVGLVLFLLNVAPFLLLWALILFWPARYVWRRLRTATEPK